MASKYSRYISNIIIILHTYLYLHVYIYVILLLHFTFYIHGCCQCLPMFFRDKSRENNCEILERESGSRYMSNLGQVSVVITERTGTQCLIAAFHPFYSPLLLFAPYLSSCNITSFARRALISRERDEKAFVSDLKALQRQLCNYYRAGIRRDYNFLFGSCLHSSYFHSSIE